MIRMGMTSVLALGMGLCSSPAFGQEVGSAVGASEPSSAGGSEIIVTARKGEERLIDVPSAVSAVAQDALLERGITSLSDLTAVVPGLNTSPNIGGSNVILRGINTGSDTAAASGVTVDGIQVGSSSSFAQGGSSGFDLDPFDLQRIEVLRGPQGTLYGASTLGGLVTYVTRKPSLTEFSGSVQGEASFTRHGEGSYVVRGAVEGPIVPGSIGLRVSGFQDKRGGYIDNSLNSVRDFNDSERYGGRAALRFAISDAITLDLAALYQKSEADGLDFIVTDSAGTPRDGILSYDEYYVPNREQEIQLYTAALSIDLGSMSLNYLGSYQDSEAQNNSNTSSDRLAGTFAALAGLGLGPALASPRVESRLYGVDLEKHTHELRLDGESGVFSWILGGYYTDEDAVQIQAETPRSITGPLTAIDPLLRFDLLSSYEEYAGFGNLTIEPVDGLEITGGFRIGRNKQTYQQLASGSALPGLNILFASIFGPDAQFVDATPTAESKETVKTYLASIKYAISPDATVYGRFATGYRPGGPNVDAPGAPPTYNNDTVESYEIGFKGQNATRTLSADIAAFYLVWNDIQVLRSINGFSNRVNGGKASARGVEASVSLFPTQGLSFNFTGAYTDAHINEPIPEVSGFDGETLPNTPKWSATLSSDYEWFLGGDWDAFVGGNIRMVSDRQTNFLAYNQAPGIRLDGYATADLRIGARSDQLEVMLFARNITDERALLGGRSLHGINEVVVSRPRTIGVMAQFNF